MYSATVVDANTTMPAACADDVRHILICGCFTLSGFAALVYQTAWTRQFALVFGTSELAVATVLAVYMAGLAIGARAAEYLLPRIARPIRLYAFLELGIAVAATLLMPVCLRIAESLLIGWMGGRSAPPATGAAGNTLFYLVAAFVTLLIPTTLMGATLPLLVRDSVHDERQIGSRIGMLYASNTGGAVLGALLAAMVLLPLLGLRATVWVAAAVNLLVFVVALALMRLDTMRPQSDLPATTAPIAATTNHVGPRWILPLMLLSGGVSFMQEVLWTRLLQRVVGSSIQAFGIMVASFLLGIALGGALGARLARSRERAPLYFVCSQVAIALAAIGSWYALLHWAVAVSGPWDRAAFGCAILLPLSFAIGVTYPLAVRVLAGGVADAPAASARVYSWNTAGAIAGSLAAGFWLIPWLKYEGTVRLSVLSSLLLATAACVLIRKPNWRLVVPLLAVLALTVALFQPARPDQLLRVSPLRNSNGEVIFYEVGRSADVVVVHDELNLDIRTNGLPEAATPVLGAPPLANVEAWMSMLAVLARPDVDDMLIVGFGGGNVVEAAPPSVRRIDVIELEPRVIDANQAIAGKRLRDPLTDSRLNIIINDARGALALTNKTYDAIISQPSHPWTAGASHLYTREFVQQAHAHLNKGGVFVQWMGAEFTDESLLRSLVATLHSVFRELRVYRPSNTTLLFMASDQPLDTELQPATVRAARARAPLHFARFGINAPEDLIAALALDSGGASRFSAGSVPITDNDNRLATANVYDHGRGMNGETLAKLLAPYDALIDKNSYVYQQIKPDISFDYLWRRVVLWGGATDSSRERMNHVAEILGNTDESLLLRYMMAMNLKQESVANDLLQKGLALWPNSPRLLYAAAEKQLSASNAMLPGSSSPQVAALPAEPAMVVAVSRFAALQRWDDVAQADEQLAAVPWTAQWGAQAAQLRAEWRMRVKNQNLRQRFGDEGIAIADRAEVTQPDVFWHWLRAWSAVGTNRPEVILESTAQFCATVGQIKAALTAKERSLIHDRAVMLATMYREQLGNDRRVEAARVALIGKKLDQVVADLK